MIKYWQSMQDYKYFLIKSKAHFDSSERNRLHTQLWIAWQKFRKFFSIDYAGRGELFEGLAIWQEEGYRILQGTCPVISLSFAKVKAGTFADTRRRICRIITELYNKNDFLLEGDCLNEKERADFQKISADMENYLAAGTYSLKVDIGFSCLAAKVTDIQGIGLSVLYKVCPALPELKMHVMGDTLLPYGKHPLIIKQPGVSIRFAANYNQLHIVQIS